MVIRFFKHISRLALPAFTLAILLQTSGCATGAKVNVNPGFKPPTELHIVYVVPFTSLLVPAEISSTAFNDLVDILNESRQQLGVQQFEIIKGELRDQDPAWLGKQLYISGEFWSYIESSGCCNTELRIRARANVTEPDKPSPSFEVFLPLESFFDHDRSTLEKEKTLLAKRIARELANRIIHPLAARR